MPETPLFSVATVATVTDNKVWAEARKIRDFCDATFPSFFTKHNIMPPIRTPLGSISGNV